jgi:hypothetical protein
MDPNTNDLKDFANNPKPFSLLKIDPYGKTFIELYRELHHRAEEEFKEHCYRSMKNYTFQKFRLSVFYRRYKFLLRHLDELCSWTYPRETELPAELLKAKNYKPIFINPWGVREYSDRINLKPVIKNQQQLNKAIRSYLSKFFKLPVRLFRNNSNLYTLSLISILFENRADVKTAIKLEDLDAHSLSIAVKNLPVTRDGNNCNICIDQLLKDRTGRKEVSLIEEIGHDGFIDHVINLSLCIMEIPPEIKKHLSDPEGMEDAQTVGDLLAAFKVTRN